jgi:hypothetical protein
MIFDPPGPPSREFILINRIEAGLWIAIAAIMLLQSLRLPRVRALAIIASVAFAAFGLSDIVETHTGAWWYPWWLLAWKGVCVITFAVLLWRWAIRRGHKQR